MTSSYARLGAVLVAALIVTSCGSDNAATPTAKKYTISGRITRATTEQLAGVTITAGSRTTSSADDGTWSVADVDTGSYTITPSKSDHTFDPATRSVRVTSGDVTGVDFVVTDRQSVVLRPEMIEVQPGTYMCGATPGQMVGGNGTRPRHQVTLTRGFFVAKTEVTQEQFHRVMGINPSKNVVTNGPVESVTILEMMAYCNAVSVREGFEPAYTITGTTFTWNRNATGYRLPTSAEWEYAARAGDTNNCYNGINQAGDPNPIVEPIAWYRFNSAEPPTYDQFTAKVHPVGLKLPNAWGLYDVLGNVWEVVVDGYAPYTADAKTDPYMEPDFVRMTVRGGAINEDAAFNSLPTRQYFDFGVKAFNFGFRIVRNK